LPLSTNNLLGIPLLATPFLKAARRDKKPSEKKASQWVTIRVASYGKYLIMES
jgi:hypothetical protein